MGKQEGEIKMKLEVSNQSPEAEIPFWIFCKGMDCRDAYVGMQNMDDLSKPTIPVPFVSLATSNDQDRYGAEIIIPHQGNYKFTLGVESVTLQIKPHYTLSFGEEFIWVFAAIVTVISSIVIYMVRKNKNAVGVRA